MKEGINTPEENENKALANWLFNYLEESVPKNITGLARDKAKAKILKEEFDLDVKISDSETENSLSEQLAQIEKNLAEQPDSVQAFFLEMKDKFFTSTEINGKKFIFTKMAVGMRDQVLSLVEDEKNPGKWKTRVFRFSGSDHQWKSYPGKRSNGDVMKGEEDNKLHHYAQSAKLHKDMYIFINTLPVVNEYVHYSQYVPKKTSENVKGYFENEFEFKENYLQFKDPEWKKFQSFCQSFYNVYDTFVTSFGNFHNFGQDSNFYKWMEHMKDYPEFSEIKKYIDSLDNNAPYAKELSNTKTNNLNRSSSPEIKKLFDLTKEKIGVFIEKYVRAKLPETMTPDFSVNKRIDAYFKPDLTGTENSGINIEEYKVNSSAGDEVVFAMAYDNQGRVYIDNIYDPRVGMNDYGIPNKITQMGHLVYKPEDYSTQVVTIPEKYKKDTGDYTDISAFLETIPVVKSFKEELKKRRVLK